MKIFIILCMTVLCSFSYASECKLKKIIVQEFKDNSELEMNCYNFHLNSDQPLYFSVKATYGNEKPQMIKFSTDRDVIISVPKNRKKEELTYVSLNFHKNKEYVNSMSSGEIIMEVKSLEDKIASGVLSYNSLNYYLIQSYHGQTIKFEGSTYGVYRSKVEPGMASYNFSEVASPY